MEIRPMLEIDVTNMVDDADEMPMLSGSCAELGQDAGRITWRNSREYAERHPLLAPDQLDDARDYFRAYGAWDDEEIDDWTPDEVQAMAVQEVASRIREMERFDSYEEYQDAAERGNVSGLVYRGDDGRFFFTMSR
jgi:hypothetical protein